MTPLRLTDEQLNQVMQTAAPIPPYLRDQYLQRVADQLRGSEFGDCEVYRACRAAAKAVMWNVVRVIDEPLALQRDRPPSKLQTAPTKRGRPIDPAVEERAARKREALARREAGERVRAEAGRRLRALRHAERKARKPIGAGD